MRKLNLFVVLFLLLAAPAFAASVSRNMVSRADPGSDLTVTFSINGATANEVFTLQEKLPSGWTIKEWSVTGAKESKALITTSFEPPKYGWSFTTTGTSAAIIYTVTLPSTQGTYSFDAVWFDKSGMSGANDGKATLAVRAIRCGDGTCEGTENSDSCIQDCPVATTQPATTRTVAPVTTTLPKAAPKKSSKLFIVLVIVLVLLIIVFFIIRKKRKDSLGRF